MKKLILFLLVCASTHMEGMGVEQLKKKVSLFCTNTRIKILYTWYNGDTLWKDGEYHAHALDCHMKLRQLLRDKLSYEDSDLVWDLLEELFYHDKQFNDIYHKLERIYKRGFTSAPCFLWESDVDSKSCSNDFKQFRKEVEKMRQE